MMWNPGFKGRRRLRTRRGRYRHRSECTVLSVLSQAWRAREVILSSSDTSDASTGGEGR